METIAGFGLMLAAAGLARFAFSRKFIGWIYQSPEMLRVSAAETFAFDYGKSLAVAGIAGGVVLLFFTGAIVIGGLF